MLFTREFKEGIRTGRVTRTYRTWKRPQAKVGGQYNLAPDGVILVTRMSLIAPESITDEDATAAGYPDAAALRTVLEAPGEPVHLVEFTYLGSGLVGQPDQGRLEATELEAIRSKLIRMDARASSAWTRDVLEILALHPGRRAGDLAPQLGWDTPTFKRQVRKLKALGLTVSLETGYELSERGRQIQSTGR
jgi:hypothetical protein